MVAKVITVALNEDDLYFITQSIGLNVPSEDDMSPQERKTYRKMNRANGRLRDKLRNRKETK